MLYVWYYNILNIHSNRQIFRKLNKKCIFSRYCIYQCNIKSNNSQNSTTLVIVFKISSGMIFFLWKKYLREMYIIRRRLKHFKHYFTKIEKRNLCLDYHIFLFIRLDLYTFRILANWNLKNKLLMDVTFCMAQV